MSPNKQPRVRTTAGEILDVKTFDASAAPSLVLAKNTIDLIGPAVTFHDNLVPERSIVNYAKKRAYNGTFPLVFTRKIKSKMHLNLNQKIAVVTGGASGIGLACANELAREGCSVAIWDLAKNTTQVANELKQTTSTPTIGKFVDVTSLSDVETAVEETERELGPIDIVVHAAAISSGKFGFPFFNVPVDRWRPVLEVNVVGMVNVAQTIAAKMVARRSGTLVFVASVAGQIGSQTDPPYSASKAANINFAQCMAKDLAPHGVRVNTVCPGMVQTPLNRSVWQAWNDQQPADRKRSYEEWADEKVRNVVPLKRWQKPEDVANLVTFLSSERASEITGQTINVDGGFVMHW